MCVQISSHAGESGIQIQISPEHGRLDMAFKGRPLLAYAFAPGQIKPYVKELYTLSGDNVIRDAPADHLHHHGLMYAIRINDVNFWEERGKPGHQRHVRWITHFGGRNAGGLPAGAISELIHWVPDESAPLKDTASAALMIERRTLSLTVNEAAQEVALHWRGEFEIGPGAKTARLHGSSYNGLGLRLPAHWDRAAKHSNSENLPYTAEQRSDVIPARWAAVSEGTNGRGNTIALFGRSANRGETRFFSMINPFTYLSVTQNLELSPLTYSFGDKFSVEYLVLVYSGPKDPAALEQRYNTWTK